MSWTLEVEHPFGAGGAGPPIKRFRATSGLGLVLHVDRGAPIAVFQSWYRVGSSHEQPGGTGMAHLFEHLMFNGTKALPTGELDRIIERVGGETNAATWVDWTYYTMSLPSSDLEIAARIESDRMQHLVLADDVLARERDVVAAERLERVDDDVSGFLSEELFRLAFEKHPYRWPTIGWMADIRGATRPAIEQFYRSFYAPNNATLVVVGDIDEAQILDLLHRYYGDIPPSDLPSVDTEGQREAAQAGERFAEFRKPVSADRTLFGYKSPAQSHADWTALDLLDTLLTGGPSSRLYRRLVVEDEIATSIDGQLMPFRAPALYELAIDATRGSTSEQARAAVDEEIAKLIDGGVDAGELDKAKACAETDFWSSLVGAEGKAEALGHYETALGDFRTLFTIADRLAQITSEELVAVAARYLRPEQRSWVVARPAESACLETQSTSEAS